MARQRSVTTRRTGGERARSEGRGGWDGACRGAWRRGLAVMPVLLLMLPALVTALVPVSAVSVVSAAESTAAFEGDVRALTRDSHRLSGSDAGRRAGTYLQRRLTQIVGEGQVYPLDMAVWQTRVVRCSLTVGERTVALRPLRPNLIVPPVTEPAGLTAPLVMGGDGSLSGYEQDPSGRIVILDYDSDEHWETALAMGAKAVVFVGDGGAAALPVDRRSVGIPANQLRFYLSRSDFETLGWSGEGEVEGTIDSAITWEQRIGRNLVAHIRGTDAELGAAGDGPPRAVVIAANYDTFGVVPTLSPGARGAGNVAAVLEAAAHFERHRPRRDVIVMLVDNQARYHQGAREVYDALSMSDEQHRTLVTQHTDERDFLRRLDQLLDAQGLMYGRGAEAAEGDGQVGGQVGGQQRAALTRMLQDEAQYIRDDLSKRVQVLRLRARQYGGEAQAQLDAVEADLMRQQGRWDEIRRALHRDELADFVEDVRRRSAAAAEPGDAEDARRYGELLDQLRSRTAARFARRLGELEMRLGIDEQRSALREALSDRWIDLHVTYNFSGDGPTWGVVLGDWTNRLFANFRLPKPEGDQPGFYGQLLSLFRQAVGSMSVPVAIEERTLTDPQFGTTFVPGPFFSSGAVAGRFGIYHVSLMTGHDARERDGHPADTVEHLAIDSLRRQAGEATAVLSRLIDHRDLALRRVFEAFVRSKYPSWSKGRSSGDYVGVQVTGSLSEDRPAAGAMVATRPAPAANISTSLWQSLAQAGAARHFQPVVLEPVDSNGRFRLIGYQTDMQHEVGALAARFDERGRVASISSRAHQGQRLSGTMRINLFTGRGYGFSTLPMGPTDPNDLKVLRATANAEFRPGRALWGQLGTHSFFYVSDYVVEDHIKLFQPGGAVALGEFTSGRDFGTGLPLDRFAFPPRLSGETADSLWRLNEQRLSRLRARGVTSADLELMHGRARGALERSADAGRASSGLGLGTGSGSESELESELSGLAAEEGALQRSAALSRRVYAPLRGAMDDLVRAIVLLLLLAIPFAFAVERLLVCATTIYGRIAGFTVCFLVTFGLLYAMHPGFAIASTPIIIFLAFAIIVLSSLVIYIVVRKFKVELKAMQGQAAGVHDLQVSHTATLLAAVGMGMSTMRRRPTRTTLTAVTVIMLTFTILSFASFSRTVGVRSVYEGPRQSDTAPGLLLRQLDYSAIPRGTLTMLSGMAGRGGYVGAHWWSVRERMQDPPFGIARADDGRFVTVDAVMGVPAEELTRWPELSEALGEGTVEQKRRWLREGAVFLPTIVASLLEVEPGDAIRVNGRATVYAGAVRGSQLQNLRHLDGQSVMPVDFQSVSTRSAGEMGGGGGGGEVLAADDVEKDFVHLSSDQVVVTSSTMARRLGGRLHVVTMYPGRGEAGESVDGPTLGREVAGLVSMPVWAAGREGVERLLMTVLTQVSGGMALAVPRLRSA